MSTLSPSAPKVQRWLRPNGSIATIVEHEHPSRTAAEAAALQNCDVARMAKSIMLKSATTARSVLFITRGANRVDEKKVAALLGSPRAKANAKFEGQQTGLAIGGVSSVAHATQGAGIMNEDQLRFERVIPAGNTPHATFAIDPAALLKLSAERMGDVKVGTR